MSHIFVSYSRKDIDMASRMVQALAENQLDTWVDWKSIPKGEDWEQEIYRGIEEADAFLFLISPDSVISKICNREITHAVKNGKRILPIVLRDAQIDGFPDETAKKEISRRNWIFCRAGQDDFHKAIAETRTTIHTDYEWLQYHTELQVKALRWERRGDASRLLRGRELREAEQRLAGISVQADPQPTKTQREYLLASRGHEERQRRWITGALSLGLVVMAALAIFAWTQMNEAQRQTKLALARQLAAQAQNIHAASNARQVTAMLLAIQSLKLNVSLEAAQFLHEHPLAKLLLQKKDISAFAIRGDSRSIVTVSSDNTVRTFDLELGEENSLFQDGSLRPFALSPDGTYLAAEGAHRSISVREVSSGREIMRVAHDISSGRAEYLELEAFFSPDHRFMISAWENSIILWEVPSGRRIVEKVFSNAEYISGSIVFSPNSAYAAIPMLSETVILWETRTGREIATLGNGSLLLDFALSPDSRYIAAGSVDGSIRIWRTSDGEEVSHMAHQGGYLADNVSDLVFSPDSKYLASASYDYTARVWEVATGNEISRMDHTDFVYSVAFSPDGKYVVSGGEDMTARVWGAQTGKEIARMTHESQVGFLAFSPDGRYILSKSRQGVLRVWEAATGREAARMIQEENTVAAFSPDGRYISLLSEGGELLVSESAIDNHPIHLNPVGDLYPDSGEIVFSPDGKYLAADGGNNTAWVREVATGKEIARVSHENWVSSVAFSPDGKYVISGSGDGTARVWEALTGKEIVRIQHESWVDSVAVSPDGNYLVSGSGDQTVRVWDLKTGEELRRLVHEADVNSVDISPDGKTIVSGSETGMLRVWEISTGNVVRSGKQGIKVFAVRYSPDGELVVSSACEQEKGLCVRATVKVWKTATGLTVSKVTYAAGVFSVAFSPDSQYVAAASLDGTVRVWEARTGKEIFRVHDETGRQFPDFIFLAVAFSPDGKYVAATRGNGTIDAWIWRPEDLIAAACARLPRNLTRAEWEQYIGEALPYQAVCPDLPVEPQGSIPPTP